MPQPASLMGLPDARAALDRALSSPQGVRLKFPSKARASAFRFRCYTVRNREAQRLARLYPDTMISTGRAPTPWDNFAFLLKSGEEVGEPGTHWYLYIVGSDSAEEMLQIEEL